jgi:hypothetical protein
MVDIPRGKDGEHTGVGVRERLPDPKDIEESQDNGRDVVGTPDQQTHPLLVILGERIDRSE